MKHDFQALTARRQKWVEANRENNFEEGIKRLLTELYPDNAHFIYELLQNAEDTGATECRFELSKDCLEFRHNGKRQFSMQDVESITSIGESTKRDDPTSIGKFGVGFKAVFAYTNTPEVSSGDFDFRIRDLVIPETISPAKDKTTGHTRFTFPFDHLKKKPHQACVEIEKGLKALGGNTLLFLEHIRKIEFRLPDRSMGRIERTDLSGVHLEIREVSGKSEVISNWLRFQKQVDVADEYGKKKSCRIAIAYSMIAEEEKKKKTADWKIEPLDHGQVSIYFPAEKETSNLRFHLHAPFASTVARDSVRDCPANNTLRDCLAELIVESLSTIRDMGMLNVTFLAVLPNHNDNLPQFYKPIQKAIIKAFQEQNLTPTRSGVHAKTEVLYAGPAKIADVLGDEGLSVMTGFAPPLWAANLPPQQQRTEQFLKSLAIDEWGWSKLAESLSYSGLLHEFSIQDKVKQKRIESWICSMSDDKLMRLYALLGEAYFHKSDCSPCSALRIIRVFDGNGDAHVSAVDAFLSPEEGITLPPEILSVKPQVYLKGRSDEQRKYALMFLKHIGIRSFDEKAAAELRITFYSHPPEHPPKEYLKDVAQFVLLYLNTPDQRYKLKDIPFLRGISPEGVEHWNAPKELYLDQPYLDTGLEAFFNDESIKLEKRKDQIIGKYSKIPRFTEFAREIGIMAGLEIVVHKATEMQKVAFEKNGRFTETTLDEDYFINHLVSPGFGWHSPSGKYHLGSIQFNKSMISVSYAVWRTMCHAEPKHLIARYIPNASKRHDEKRGPSLLVKQLKATAWIPDKEGTFKKPADICKEELHPDFQYDDRNGWLTAIGFGENVRKRSEEYRAKNSAAKQFGFESADKAAKWAELEKAGLNPDDLLATHKKPELPEGGVNNPERRRKRMQDDSANAPDKESVKRERSVQPGINEDTAKAKAYLRANYVNPDGDLICQCCRQIMPFMVGELYYFEAVKCIKDLQKRHIENRLALCPVCAAKYQYAGKTDDQELQSRIINHVAPDTAPAVEIPVHLAGKEYKLHFVGKHWFDLKTILESA